MIGDGKIFRVDKTSNSLSPLTETPFDKEDILQKFLLDFPDLLGGDQLTPDNPRRWLAIKREKHISKEIEDTRFRIDNLFVDQDGILTFVECKRANNTQIRREVVAQMLDYVSRAKDALDIEELKKDACKTALEQDKDVDKLISDMVNLDEIETDDHPSVFFWNIVKTKINEEKFRLLFVSDKNPPELRSIVEFMNRKMPDIEIYAVDVKEFTGDDAISILVPRVLGVTESTVREKTTVKRKTTIDEYLEKLPKERPNEVREFIEKLFKDAGDRGYLVDPGEARIAIRTKRNRKAIAWAEPKGPLTIFLQIQDVQFSTEILDQLKGILSDKNVFVSKKGDKYEWKPVAENIGPVKNFFNIFMDKIDQVLAQAKV